jgi:hypothetical protein
MAKKTYTMPRKILDDLLFCVSSTSQDETGAFNLQERFSKLLVASLHTESHLLLIGLKK